MVERNFLLKARFDVFDPNRLRHRIRNDGDRYEHDNDEDIERRSSHVYTVKKSTMSRMTDNVRQSKSIQVLSIFLLMTGCFVVQRTMMFHLRQNRASIIDRDVLQDLLLALSLTATSKTTISRTQPSIAYLTENQINFNSLLYKLKITLNNNNHESKNEHEKDRTSPDYGGLQIEFKSNTSQLEERSIPSWDNEKYHVELNLTLFQMDQTSDENHNFERYYGYDDINHNAECSPTKWSYSKYPTCIHFHDTIQYVYYGSEAERTRVEYIDSGYFRDTFLFNLANNDASVVLKSLRYRHEYDDKNMVKINNEALIMERLTASPTITNIYGHCGTSVLVEKGSEIYRSLTPRIDKRRGRIEQSKLDQMQQNDVHPFNKYTTKEKLNMAVTMAQSIAELHGYVDGAFTMEDLETYQWLLSDADGRIMLNDFGNSYFLKYDTSENRYCKYFKSYYSGTYHAPEYYNGGDYVDESSDIWSFGNVLFSLLTGLKPYYQVMEDDYENVIIQMMINGTLPYIDPRYRTRSYIEGRMVKIMNKCFQRNPKKRATIFEVLQDLEETKRQALINNTSTEKSEKNKAETKTRRRLRSTYNKKIKFYV